MITKRKIDFLLVIGLIFVLLTFCVPIADASDGNGTITLDNTTGNMGNSTITDNPTELIPAGVATEVAKDAEFEIQDCTKSSIHEERTDNNPNLLKSSGTITKFTETSKLNQEKLDLLERLQQYDLVSFDHQSLNKNIESKQGLSIRIKGIEYRTYLKRMNFKTIGVTQT